MTLDDRDVALLHTHYALGGDSPTCLRLFARGPATGGCCGGGSGNGGGGVGQGCYVLGSWAHVAARDYIKSTALLKRWGDEGAAVPRAAVDVVVVNDSLCKEMIRDCLLRRGVSVEYYERASSAAAAAVAAATANVAPVGGGQLAYVCVQRATPGNLADFEAILFEGDDADVQLAASGAVVFATSSLPHKDATGAAGGAGAAATTAMPTTSVRVGFAMLNTTLRQIAFAEYDDTLQLASLDALVAQTNLKELLVLLPSSSSRAATAAHGRSGNSNGSSAAAAGGGGGGDAVCDERVRAVRRICERAGVTCTLLDRRGGHCGASVDYTPALSMPSPQESQQQQQQESPSPSSQQQQLQLSPWATTSSNAASCTPASTPPATRRTIVVNNSNNNNNNHRGASVVGDGGRCGAAMVERALGTLRDVLRVPEERMTLLSCPLAAHALQTLLTATLDVLDAGNERAFYLRRITPSTHMQLDAAAIDALHLVSRKPEPRGGLPLSVFAWLNRCQTGMGARAMRQWLLQPLRNVDDIVQRQTMVSIMLEHAVVRDTLLTRVLRRCGDLDRLNRKLQRRTVSLKDTQAYLHFVQFVVPGALDALRLYSGPHTKLLTDEFVAPLDEMHAHMGNLRTLIEVTVDYRDRYAARINAEFDDTLQELHAQLQRVRAAVEDEYARVLHAHGWSERQLKHEYHATHGYVFRIARKDDRALRASGERPPLRIVATAKDGVRFVSHALAALSEQYRRIHADYTARQHDLQRKLIDTIATYLPLLDDAKELIAALDVFVAWSLVVKDSPRGMVRPIVTDAPQPPLPTRTDATPTTMAAVGAATKEEDDTDDAGLVLLSMTQLRHPLLALRCDDFVANSVQLTTRHNALVITGPNMGGKSTFMRSVGIATVLAQAGCYVPAAAAQVCVRDAVMCRVGATDHLAQGVSTFMVEMLESAAILAAATPRTLAIVDELGRGTSTYDGFGLAWAIAKEVAVGIRATLLFSTHFHELTRLPAEHGNVRNAHFGAVVAHASPPSSSPHASGGDGECAAVTNNGGGDAALRFSYRLEPGACGRSYGLYVAALAQMPAEVVARARQKAAELETFDNGQASDDGGGGGGGGDVAQRNAASTAMLATAADDAEVVCHVAAYAQRARELERMPEGAAKTHALEHLRVQVASDEAVCALVRGGRGC